MHRLKDPVFEKPDQPNFLKRIREAQEEEVKKFEDRPLTDAPVREDEMPAVAHEVDEADLEKLRALHGLVRSVEATTNTNVGNQAKSTKKATVDLGSSQGNLRKRRKLEELKSKRSTEAKTELVASATQRKGPLKTAGKKTGPRTRMRMSFNETEE